MDADYKYLPHINSPADLRQLPLDALPKVCDELRHDIIKELSDNPGHFASSLGTVEITVALHYVFDTPYDRLVWDVGHQAYAHKILTGRRDAFHTNRKLHGIRPFPSPEESEYDTFPCGHASNSISAALGMALATLKNGHPDRHVVALIGDGAMSGGLAFEGLNNASDTPNNLLVILNDNNMSIDRPVGGMKEYLLHLHTSNRYNRLRFALSHLFEKIGWLTPKRRNSILRFNNSLKSLLTNQQNIFEGLNIRYLGPTDGHNVKDLVRVLREIKDMKGPKLLHLHTVKGKGYKPAEQSATIWHAPGKFDPETDKRIIDKLSEASCAGVKIDLIVRGICCLIAGVPGKTENIRVTSIVGRFLEHSRIYIFGPRARARVYIASADFMTRNTLRRVEVAAPILDEALRSRLLDQFETMLHDNVQARVMLPDGSYVRREHGEEAPLSAQEFFYQQAYDAAGK